MGVSLSCPFAKCSEVEAGFESVVVKSIKFGNSDAKTPVRSVSFNGRNSEPEVLKSLGSGRMALETSVSFKRNEFEKMISFKNSSIISKKNKPTSAAGQKTEEVELQSPTISGCFSPQTALEPNSPKHMAALKLQKVYKSFRTRRKLADCAILVEQSWWKLLDFAELKHSSISFFDIEKHETALSRWSRARTRAAKVGKGLSKDGKAQKLALQHWLEAIDPRHRYGHNLHFYYDKWLHCQSKEPFFYWLDIGEGKEVNLEKCPRSKLQQQCIKYLGPMERLAYEVVVVDGKFQYKQSGNVLHTTEDESAKWIFVLSTSKSLYVGKKKKGTFQHSSFLAGGATSAAGRLVVEHGILKAVWPHSGHYRPTEENFKEFVSFLKDNNVDLSDVKMSPVDEADDVLSKQRSSIHLRSNSSEEDMMEDINAEDTIVEELTDEKESLSEKGSSSTTLKALKSRNRFHSFRGELTNLKIPNRSELVDAYQSENEPMELIGNNLQTESSTDGYGTADSSVLENDGTILNGNVFDEDDETDMETIPKESILKRINSHKEAKSYQLGKQLSCKWTTGAGPRIGCVRDYPSELQFRALEQVSLSPRSASSSRAYFSPRLASRLSPRMSMPTVTGRDNASEVKNLPQTWQQPSRTQSSPLDLGSYDN